MKGKILAYFLSNYFVPPPSVRGHFWTNWLHEYVWWSPPIDWFFSSEILMLTLNCLKFTISWGSFKKKIHNNIDSYGESEELSFWFFDMPPPKPSLLKNIKYNYCQSSRKSRARWAFFEKNDTFLIFSTFFLMQQMGVAIATSVIWYFNGTANFMVYAFQNKVL